MIAFNSLNIQVHSKEITHLIDCRPAMKRTALFRTIPTENESKKYSMLEVLDTGKKIARGTTNPGYWLHKLSKSFSYFIGISLIGCKFGYQMAPLNIDYKFGYPEAVLASVREDTQTKKTFKLGHCPNYLNPHPWIRTTLPTHTHTLSGNARI